VKLLPPIVNDEEQTIHSDDDDVDVDGDEPGFRWPRPLEKCWAPCEIPRAMTMDPNPPLAGSWLRCCTLDQEPHASMHQGPPGNIFARDVISSITVLLDHHGRRVMLMMNRWMAFGISQYIQWRYVESSWQRGSQRALCMHNSMRSRACLVITT
jgi:hypothetical protein